MRYVAAYLLAVIGGNKNPSSDDIEKILSSVGIEAEKEKLNKVIKELHGKDVRQLIEQGKGKLSSMPSGAKKEEKKEEKEESDEDMGFGLFD
ncbi:60S acidic ribosomal protein P2 [Chamberlinius hualienensis]